MAMAREIFHSIANCHNKITIAACCMIEALKDSPLDTLSKEGLKSQHKKLIDVLEKMKDAAIRADEHVLELKSKIKTSD